MNLLSWADTWHSMRKCFFMGDGGLPPDLLLMFGVESTPAEFRFISEQGVSTLHHISIPGGVIACLYATC